MDEALLARYPELESDHFWWTTRRRLVRDLVGVAGSGAVLEVLDVGCGSGVTAGALATDGARVVGVDVEKYSDDGAEGQAGFERVVGDYIHISTRLGQFDVVLALDAIEHFEDEGTVVEALSNNLRPGGMVIVTVPAYEWLWSSHDLENQHHRRYTRRRLRAAFERGGLTVDRVGYLFLGLVIPKSVVCFLERLRGRGIEIGHGPPAWLNKVAEGYFRFETRLAKGLTNFLPAGTSVICLASKPTHSIGGEEQARGSDDA
jgi:SAM-dependent methyltransferase